MSPRSIRLDRRTLRMALTIGVLAIGVVVAREALDLGELVAMAVAADRRLVAIAVAIYACSWPLRGRRYGEILRAMDRPGGVGFLTGAIFVSQTANLVVPARAGDGLRAYLIKERYATAYPIGAASLVVERAYDLFALALFGGFAVLLLGAGDGTAFPVGEIADRGSLPLALGVGLTLGGIVVTAGVVRADREIGSAISGRLADTRWTPIVTAVTTFGGAVRDLATAPRALVRIGLWSVLVWLLDVASALLVLAAVEGISPTPTVAWQAVVVGTLAVCAGNLAKSLPSTHGGLGVYEAAFAAVLAGLAPVGPAAAVLVAVLDHALKNVVTVVGGGLATVALDISPVERPPRSDGTA